MQFYDSTNKQGILQEIDRLCDTDDISYPRVDKTSRVNNSLEEVISTIIHADGTWEYDDTNQTDLPIGTGDLVEGQEQYSFAAEYLNILAIEILDSDGNRYRRIKPFDHQELGGLSPDEYFGVTSSGNPATGTPRWYDKIGDSIFLYPAPTSTAVTLVAGLKVYFQRTAKLFTVASDTSADTTEPGLPSTHHVILAYMAAIPYNEIYHKDRVVAQERKVAKLMKSLLMHFGKREKDKRKILHTRIRRFR